MRSLLRTHACTQVCGPGKRTGEDGVDCSISVFLHSCCTLPCLTLPHLTDPKVDSIRASIGFGTAFGFGFGLGSGTGFGFVGRLAFGVWCFGVWCGVWCVVCSVVCSVRYSSRVRLGAARASAAPVHLCVCAGTGHRARRSKAAKAAKAATAATGGDGKVDAHAGDDREWQGMTGNGRGSRGEAPAPATAPATATAPGMEMFQARPRKRTKRDRRTRQNGIDENRTKRNETGGRVGLGSSWAEGTEDAGRAA